MDIQEIDKRIEDLREEWTALREQRLKLYLGDLKLGGKYIYDDKYMHVTRAWIGNGGQGPLGREYELIIDGDCFEWIPGEYYFRDKEYQWARRTDERGFDYQGRMGKEVG